MDSPGATTPPSSPQIQPQEPHPSGAHPDAIARTLSRHPKPLGGDPLRTMPAPKLSLSSMVLNNQDGQAQLGSRHGAEGVAAEGLGVP